MAERADLSLAETWSALRVGDRLGPIAWRLDDGARAARLAAIGADPGGDILPPPFFLDAYYALMDLRYIWPLAIAAKTEVASFAAAAAAATYDCDLEIADKYERRGGRYVVTLTRARDEGGRLMCALRNTALVNPADVPRR